MKKFILVALLFILPFESFANDSETIRDVMKNSIFRERVRSIVLDKAYEIMRHVTTDETMVPAPDANTIAWAKTVATTANYDGYTEAIFILWQSKPASVNAALIATDVTYNSTLDTVLNEIVAAKN